MNIIEPTVVLTVFAVVAIFAFKKQDGVKAFIKSIKESL